MKWQLTIDITRVEVKPGGGPNVWVVTGEGPKPTLADLTSPVTPPKPPPIVGDPYAPQLGEDTSLFVWPPEILRTAEPSDRSYALSHSLTGADYYAIETSAGNPVGRSHRVAGVIAAGGVTDYGRAVGGLHLWVRVVAGENPLTGTPRPPAPPHLIRRALAQGHL